MAWARARRCILNPRAKNQLPLWTPVGVRLPEFHTLPVRHPIQCHTGPALSSTSFHTLGGPMAREEDDLTADLAQALAYA